MSLGKITRVNTENASQLVLGIEGGGTKTEWLLVADGKVVGEGRLPGANLRLISDSALGAMFRELSHEAARVGVFLAGCATQQDAQRLAGIVRGVWPHAATRVGSDRDSGFATAFGDGDGVLVIAGTGSAVTGRKAGQIEKAAGWGQVLGDIGGGYTLAVGALRGTLFHYDISGEVTELGHQILRTLGLSRLHELAEWVMSADKMSVAQLAPVVFSAARAGDASMLRTLQDAAKALARYTAAVAARLPMDAPSVALMGGLFAHHAEYGGMFCDYLSELLPHAVVKPCFESGAVGAVRLASKGAVDSDERGRVLFETASYDVLSATTEQPNPRSEQLSTMTPEEIVALFIEEEPLVIEALDGARENLTRGVQLITEVLRGGGRLFYVGAGTSGRLGVLDASEIPPTFGAPPEMVQGIMAGGFRALHTSVEGAEDSPEAGALALLERGVRAGDAVCGITASGRTPFVLGALGKARDLAAQTLLITCNPNRPVTFVPDVAIDLATGPELLTGSTRLKAGTATKLALNILSTGAMIGLGHVSGNRMVDVRASNAKLRTRAAHIVAESLGCSNDEAQAKLRAADWNIRRAVEVCD